MSLEIGVYRKKGLLVVVIKASLLSGLASYNTCTIYLATEKERERIYIIIKCRNYYVIVA